jgi:hypothetical protein
MAHPLSLPTRVSRLYPVLTVILLLTSSAFLYAWQVTKIDLNSLPDIISRNQSLENTVQTLTASSKLDQATLQIQQQKINDTTKQLSALQSQISTLNTTITQQKSQIANQQNQLSQNASEIQSLRERPPLFSFQNNSNLANISQKEASVKTLISNAYSYIQNLYGAPYMLNQITVDFVSGLSLADSSGEIIITSSSKGVNITIELKDFDPTSFQDNNTVIHEMIHGFHGVAVFQTSAIEEGMTVAATDAVMARMIADQKLPDFNPLYLVINNQQYNQWNQSLTVYQDNNKFYNDPNVAEVYQLVGTAWSKLYQQDPNIFTQVNAYYYPKVEQGENATTNLALDAIRQSISKVGNEDISTFLSTNKAFNPV